MEKLPLPSNWIYKAEMPEKLIQISLQSMREIAEHGWLQNQSNLVSKPDPFEKIESFLEVKKWVQDRFEDVRKDLDLLCEGLKISAYWGNLTKKGQFHHRHFHYNAVASSVLYLTPSESGTLFFLNNHWADATKNGGLLLMGEDKTDLVVKHKSTPGTFLVFPSHLQHSVDPVQEDEDRFTLSFNAFSAGEIGGIKKHPGIGLTLKVKN